VPIGIVCALTSGKGEHMETSLNRNERVIAIVALATISAFFAMFMMVNRTHPKASAQFESDSVVDYKMARPEEAYSEYTLDGREIDQTYEPLTVKEEKLSKKKQELIAKQNTETKKKEELKKKQAAAVKTQAQNQAKAQAVRPQVPVSTSTEVTKSRDSQGKTTNNNYVPQYNYNSNVQATKTDDKTNTDVKAPKKTFADWRKLLFANPTSENLAAFLAAFRKTEVTSTEYYAMAQDLVDQSDTKQKALGLMALRTLPSLTSLSQLFYLNVNTIGAYQSYVDQSLLAYLAPQNIAFLAQALVTQDKALKVKVLTLLNVNLTKFSQGDLTGLEDPRNRRDGDIVVFSMANYRSLVPVLAQLLTSQDQELAALASQVTSVIQSSNNIAQN
jgi:hypothetical protein